MKPAVKKTKPAKFKPANKLEKLLLKASKRAGAKAKFYQELSRSDVYAVPLNRPAIRNGKAAEGEKLQLLGYSHNDVFFIAFFSSEERVGDAKAHGTGAIKMSAPDFFTLTRGSYLVLNPASGLGKEFFPAEIEQLMREDFNKNID